MDCGNGLCVAQIDAASTASFGDRVAARKLTSSQSLGKHHLQ
jgi:hypothetical protein